MEENKVEITKLLQETINATREGKVTLEYKENVKWQGTVYPEAVIITCERGGAKDIVNVSCDSGCALIRDVIKHRWFT